MNSLKPVSILLVDDNRDHADIMIDALEEFNIKNIIHHVEDGEEAILFLNNSGAYEDSKGFPTPDLIFLDIRMPRQDGIETLKLIKQSSDFAYIPVVMVSTSTSPEEISECHRLGASGYLSKPIEFDALAQKMKEINYYWMLVSDTSL